MFQVSVTNQNAVADIRPSLPSRCGPLLLGSALAGQAITYARGTYTEAAVLCVVTGLLVVLHNFARSLQRESRALGDAGLVASLLWIALFAMLWTAINDSNIIIYAHRPWVIGKKAQWLSLFLLATYVPWITGSIREPPVLGWVRFAGFLGLVLLVGIDTIHCSPAPRIDVWGIQMQGAEALRHGKNPYQVVAAQDTGPGTLKDAVPYVYPPTQVYVTLLGWLLGDVRYSMLGAVLIAALAMRFITARSGLPSFAKDAPALFLLLTPKLFFILEQAWVDPVQVMFIALGLAAAARWRLVLAAVLFGIAGSSKQTMFWVPALAGFCLSFRFRHWLVLGVSAVLPLLPFLLWDFKALKYANFDVLNGLPYRADALTLNNWALFNLQFDIPGSVGFILAATVVALSCWKLRGPAQLGTAVAATYYVFFAFNRWAFANYYFLISGLLALAAAASCSTWRGTTSIRT